MAVNGADADAVSDTSDENDKNFALCQAIVDSDWATVREVLAREPALFLSDNFVNEESGFTAFQCVCMGLDIGHEYDEEVPLDILSGMVAIDKNNMFCADRDSTRWPVELAAMSGHPSTLRFIFDNVPKETRRKLALQVAGPNKDDGPVIDSCWRRCFDERSPDNVNAGGIESVQDFVFSFGTFQAKRKGKLQDDIDMSPRMAAAWKKSKLFLAAAYSDTTDELPPFVLHRLLQGDNVLPGSDESFQKISSIVPWLLLQLYPEEVSKEDQNGNLPLHCACMSDFSSRSMPYILSEACETSLSDAAIAQLQNVVYPPYVTAAILDEFPEATDHRNKAGRLPIHVAAANYLSNDNGCVINMIQAAPNTVNVPDPVTGLLPFMLAAATAKEEAPSTTFYNEPETYQRTICTKIYALLRENPVNILRAAGSSEMAPLTTVNKKRKR